VTYDEILRRCPIVGAPLAEITDYPFRLIQRRYIDGLLHTEMVSTHALFFGSEKTCRMIETVPDEVGPIGIQIMGSDESVVASTIRKVLSMKPAVIDINMACPVKKIVKSACGASLLDDLERAKAVVRAARNEAGVPIGVKIRLGIREVTVERTVEALADAGVDAISIHGRTAAQMYTGKADRAAILAAARRVSVPVIASGDIFTVDDVRECLAGGARGVLVARGMMGRPWFLAEARAAALGTPPPLRPSAAESAAIAIEHLGNVVEFYGPDGLRKFRRHLVEYVRGLPGAPALRHALVTARTPEQVEAILMNMTVAAV
jgi:nifR3 family TIM-barrel protein